jgi:Trp operon repressor
MPPVSGRYLKKELQDKITSLFLAGLAQVKSKDKAKYFFEAIFTDSERKMLAKRFAVFYLLEKNIPQDEIAGILKMSTSSITRLNYKWKSLSKAHKEAMNKIMLRNEVKNLFIDMVNTFQYGPLPPKYRNWTEWRKAKNKWLKDIENPLR